MNITPRLAFNNTVEEAVEFYARVFSHHTDAEVDVKLPGEPGQSIGSALLNIGGAHIGTDIMLINLGESAVHIPAMSFLVNFETAFERDAEQQLEALWDALRDAGAERLPLAGVPIQQKV